jgi:hypothetical protein
MDGQAWLERSLLPSLQHLSDAGDDTPGELQALMLLRAWGAVDALEETGVLDGEQVERARAALAEKGVTSGRTQVFAQSFVAGATARAASTPAPIEQAPEVLHRVIGVGRVMGLVDDEPLTMLSVELWSRTVRAEFLLLLGERIRAEQEEHHRAMREWGERQRAGEGGPPPVTRPWHPGSSLTWALVLDGTRTEGTLASGGGGGREWRQAVAWQVAVPDTATELTVEVLDGHRTVGRVVVPLT